MFLKRFWGNQDGNAAIMFSLAAVPLVVGAGMAVDYSNWRYQETHLQGVADAAALAGVVAYTFEGNSKKDQGQAESLATTAINGYIDAHHADLNAAPQIIFTQDPKTVAVTFSETGKRSLTSLLPGSDANINVNATATMTAITTSPCVIGLNEAATPAVRFSGSGPMTAEGCAVWSNSTQSVAMEGSGSGLATATMFCAAGGVLGGSTTFSVPPQSNCPKVEDPLATLEMPPIGICKETNLQISASGIVPIDPGVYCGGIKLTSTATLQLAPGEYILTDGPLEMVGGSSIEGTGVTIFMTGTNSGLKLGGASSINISAPTSGPYAGVALYSDRTSPIQSSALRGSNSLDIEGTIYLPNHDLSYSGSNSTTLPAAFTVLIANTVEFTGSSEVSIRSDFDASAIPVPTAILQGRILPRLIR